MFISLTEWLLIVCHVWKARDWRMTDGRKWFVVRQNFLLTDSKLQGLVNVNIKIRECHSKMFCTSTGTKKKNTFSRRAAGYHFRPKKSKSCPKSNSVSIFYFSLERLLFDFSTLTIKNYRDTYFAIDNVLQITSDSLVSCELWHLLI